MERSTRVILGIAAIILFLCCVAGLGFTLLGTRLMGKAIITDPDRIALVGSDIAEYDIPQGFRAAFASNVSGFKLIALGPTKDSTHFTMILIMQFPAPVSANREEVERQMRQALTQQTGMGSASLSVVDETIVEIKGKPVELTVQEGTTSDGIHIRQITGIFDGKQGPVLLMIIGEAESWNEEMVRTFLASIH
jgi:hypothetical protein